MYPSETFFSQLRRHEGFYEKPYVCPAGVATIGYGTNLEAYPAYVPLNLRAQVESGKLKGRPLVDALLKQGMSWSRANAESAMNVEVDLCRRQLERKCPAYGALMARDDFARAECLINMCFNMGIGNPPDASRNIQGRGLLSFVNTLSLIERGDFKAASANMLQSRWAKEVKGRAVELAQQMRTGKYQI